MDIAFVLLVYTFAAFVLLICLVALFGPWLTLAIKSLELSGKKAFLGQLCRQSARLNLWFGSLFSVLVLGALFSGYFKLKGSLPPPEMLQGAIEAGLLLPPPAVHMVMLTAYFLLFVFLLALSSFSWVKLRSRPVLQFILLALTAVAGSSALLVTFFTVVERPQILNTYYYLSIFTWTAAMYPFGVPTALSSLLMICKFVSGGLGIAVTMTMCGLLIFRKRDDFGRDYYNFAIRHLSRWGLACTVLTLASGLGMMYLLQNIIGNRFNLGYSDIILTSLICASCMVFYFSAMRSPTPLRHKAGIWISLLALLVAMLGHLIYVRSFFIATGMMMGLLPVN